jgi:hypothetical protein
MTKKPQPHHKIYCPVCDEWIDCTASQSQTPSDAPQAHNEGEQGAEARERAKVNLGRKEG